MKYPLHKKSFWITLASLFLIICLIPPYRILVNVHEGFAIYHEGGFDFFFNLGEAQSISWGMLILEMMIAFLLDYLVHLILSKPEIKPSN